MVMPLWRNRKKYSQTPGDLDLDFEGTVKRIQFNPPGGFKMTVVQSGKTIELWVPNDPGNRHCQFIRQWICDGGFPEDADYTPPLKVLGLQPGIWRLIGEIIVGAAAVAAVLVAWIKP